MTAMQRTKGARGERELAKELRDRLGVDAIRNLIQTREGGTDVLGLPGWAVEVKRAVKGNINFWWAQTCDQSERAQEKPVLFYRLDRMKWRVIVALRDVVPGLENQSTLKMTLETDLDTFCAIYRESLQ